MIRYLEGTVHTVSANSLTVVTYGVGREVFVTPAVAGRVRTGSEVALHTELIVREDALTLYGFDTPGELKLFSTLLGANGVGPKLALAILSVLSPDQVYGAISDNTPKVLTAVPGVGPKVAAKLIVDLQGKVPATSAVPSPQQGPPAPRWCRLLWVWDGKSRRRSKRWRRSRRTWTVRRWPTCSRRRCVNSVVRGERQVL